eukprot:scaffold3.g6735.t1
MPASLGGDLRPSPPAKAASSASRHANPTRAIRQLVLRPRLGLERGAAAPGRAACLCAARAAAGEAASSGAVALRGDAYAALEDCRVYRVSTQELVDVTSLWELARALKRDVLPALAAKGGLFLVSIGTPQRGLEFVDKTGFPADLLLADPDNVTYERLGLKKGVRETFLARETPLAIWERIKSGRVDDLRQVLSLWTKTPLWIPPKQDQAFQQARGPPARRGCAAAAGGAVVFEGRRVLFAHYDPSTGAHVDMRLLVEKATKGL